MSARHPMGTRGMRELIRQLVCSELDVPEDLEATSEEAELASGLVLKVLQSLSLSTRRPTGGPAGEAAIGDLVSSYLLQGKRSDSHGLDCHLRFRGLHQRLQALPSVSGARGAVLRTLYLLRSGGAAGGAGLGGGGGPGQRPGAFAGDVLDPFPASARSRAEGRAAAAAAVGELATERQGAPRGSPPFVPRLGWHHAAAGAAAGGGGTASAGLTLPSRPRPSSLQEQDLLRDLLHALQGVDSPCFRLSRGAGGSSELAFETSPAVVLSRPAWFLAQSALDLGRLHLRLKRATSAELEAEGEQSLLRQALCEALRHQLRDYYKVLAHLMASIDGTSQPGGSQPSVPEMTLRRLWTWLQGPLQQMRLLVMVCESCAPLRGGALASAVFGFSRVGDAAGQKACLAILHEVVRPLLVMIRAWMTEGELQDPFSEFFVCVDASVPLEQLWTRMYSLDVEMVPSFIPLELARKILLTGKSVNFIRLCCPGQDWFAAVHGGAPGKSSIGLANRSGLLALPVDPHGDEDIPMSSSHPRTSAVPLSDLSERVEQAAVRTNKHLVSLLMNQYSLGEHCHALRRFLLLGQGDFVESLLDNAAEELGKEATGEVYKHQLMGILEMAVRQSNAQFCHPDILARLHVKMLMPSAGEKVWDIFLLDYAIDSPLHVVFTPKVMQQYDRAFAFLWKLRRMSHALASCWRQHMSLQRHLIACGRELSLHAPELGLEIRQTLHKCTCLRNEMHHFSQNISSYVMCEVLEAAWAKLQAGWHECGDLDEVIREHEKYLACIEEGSFLARAAEPIMTALTALFTLTLEFTSLHDQVCASAFEAVEMVSNADEDGPMPFARSLAECRAQLDQIGAGFLMRLQTLLRALEAQPPHWHLSSDLRFLLCRLDFNGYYEQKRPSPFNDRLRVG